MRCLCLHVSSVGLWIVSSNMSLTNDAPPCRWDGGYQIMPIMTNWMASVYNGEMFSNMTDMFSIRQVGSSK